MATRKSALSMSMHKAGSSIADLILTDFFETMGYEIDRVANKVSASPLTEPEFFDSYQPQMQPDGVYYGMARNPGTHDLTFLRDFRVAVQVRDPRDCLTSAFFSLRGSHVPPTDPVKLAEYEKRQRNAQAQDIKAFVLRTAPNYQMRGEKLQKVLQDYPDTLFLTYEEMVTDTEAWLKRIADWTGQPLDAALREKLGKKIDFSVSKEDASKHKRQVSPGDHRRKLDAETISEINNILASSLKAFGYPE